MHISLRIAFLLVSGFCAAVTAQTLDSWSNDNRSLFLSPRSMAMGGNAGSVTADALPTSNPAGLCLDTANRMQLNYAGWYENALSTGELGFARPVSPRSVVGISLNYLHIPDIEYNAESIADPSGTVIEYRSRTVSASEISLNVAGARRFTFNRFAGADIGAALHGMRRRLPDEEGKAYLGYGVGIDAGVAVFEKRSGLRLGVMAADAGTNYLQWNSDYHNTARPRIYGDLSLHREVPYIYGTVTICLRTDDLLSLDEGQSPAENPAAYGLEDDSPLKNLPPVGAGIEYSIRQTVALRAGIDPDKKISFGAGLSLFRKKLDVDMAYALPSGLPGTYVIGLGWRW